MPYAVNLADWAAHKDDIGLSFLLRPVVDSNGGTVIVNTHRYDEVGVPLACDEEQAEAIVAVVRTRYATHVVRCYYSKTGRGGWKRVRV